MQLLIYLIIYPFLWIISILPYHIFYLFSDFVCFLTYNFIGYRKKVVRNNIKLALPHLSDNDRLAIEKKFYIHLCDMFLEMIKTISISQKEIEKRFTFSNMEVYYDLEKKNKSIALMCAHYAS
ncbi:MAG: lysophospholipid acyltransferase family protein, partial [Flavobacterium sp.]